MNKAAINWTKHRYSPYTPLMDQKNTKSKPHRSSGNPKNGGRRIKYADRRRKRKPAVSSRLVVLDLMAEIIGKGHPLQEAIKRHEDWGKLDDRDRRFARRLITITLRYRRTARTILNRYLQKPNHRKDRKAEAILILAVVELIWADGDGYAVVDQAVRMMRGKGFTHMTGLANAVLRKIANDQDALRAEEFDPMINAPQWLSEHLKRDWGDKASSIMRAFLSEPSLDFSCKNNPEEWAKKLDGALLGHESIRRRDGNPALLEGYDEGNWWVQDAAAALPAIILQKVSSQFINKTVVDLCAAPGGKTAQLVAMGANVTAVDNAPERLKTLKANMSRLQMSPEVITADGKTWTPSVLVDAVLLDAPCSATGTLRRRPDIFSHEQAPDFKTLNTLQKDLLHASAKWLKPGGVMVYATCSILKIEGEHILENLPKDVSVHPLKEDDIEGINLQIDENGFARAMPDAVLLNNAKFIPEDMDSSENIPQGNDGFFIACLIKN